MCHSFITSTGKSAGIGWSSGSFAIINYNTKVSLNGSMESINKTKYNEKPVDLPFMKICHL